LKSKGYPVKLVKFLDGKRTDVEYSNNALSSNTHKSNINNHIVDVSTSKELTYFIQIGTYSSQKNIKDFNDLQSLYFQKLDDGKFRYFTEKTFDYADAQKKLQNIKSKGYTDAMVVAFYKGKQIKLEDAQNLEKTLKETQTVYFRVQVGAFSSKLTDEQIKQKYAKLKDFKLNTHNKKDLIVYSVGNTTSYDEAKNTLEKVKSLGYTDAFIIALRNNVQIPLDKAIK